MHYTNYSICYYVYETFLKCSLFSYLKRGYSLHVMFLKCSLFSYLKRGYSLHVMFLKCSLFSYLKRGYSLHVMFLKTIPSINTQYITGFKVTLCMLPMLVTLILGTVSALVYSHKRPVYLV